MESIRNKIEFLEASILDNQLLEKITRDVDGVFHQAALTSVQESFSRPEEYYNVNVNGTENILKLFFIANFKIFSVPLTFTL